MTLFGQLLLGGALFLGACMMHLAVLIVLLARVRGHVQVRRGLFVLMFLGIAASHIAQIWLWAVSLFAVGATAQFDDSLYFALVTYTTVGYGDITLSDDTRILGALASFAGILSFGMSTALIVSLFTRALERE
jgi:hypothetical protein